MTTTQVAFDRELVSRYDRPGPRYTSYPTAVQFKELSEADYRAAAARSGSGPLSLYLHIPFCASPCFYCGCSKIITRDRGRSAVYAGQLVIEAALQAALFDRARVVEQLHLGGGTPTYLSVAEIGSLLEGIGRHFTLATAAKREFSIEVDPRTLAPADMAGLAALGFNRLSLGVQDFDPDVQQAVNRVQSRESTVALMAAAREASFRSISIDLIYGLPRQTPTTFARTLDAVIDAAPDRLAVYSYAHLPQLFKPQRRIDASLLPSGAEKLGLLQLTIERLVAAGYVYIGMDHFARPDDELARALGEGSLQRNFQGYSTRAECTLVGLGMTSIGSVGDCYAQNAKTLPAYYSALAAERLPVVRGLVLTDEDRLRREVIQSIMCQSRLDYAAFEARHGIVFESHFATAIAALAPLAADGLLRFGTRGFELTPVGRLLTRNVAMCFDAYLPAHAREATAHFSRAV
jgi:oxygen-independent coproporphyrinogen-3 oxidase